MIFALSAVTSNTTVGGKYQKGIQNQWGKVAVSCGSCVTGDTVTEFGRRVGVGGPMAVNNMITITLMVTSGSCGDRRMR